MFNFSIERKYPGNTFTNVTLPSSHGRVLKYRQITKINNNSVFKTTTTNKQTGAYKVTRRK